MSVTSQEVLFSLESFLREEEQRNGGKRPAIDPGPRKHFIWPHRPLSTQYNVKPGDFTKTIRFEIHGEAFAVEVAETAFGIFGKCNTLKAEAKGNDEEQMLINLERELEPLFERQFAISRVLGLSRRYEGSISELHPTQIIRLLYCPDRDVAHTAMAEIETHARSGIYTLALIRILKDESHPYRRIAQWCALDIFEDLQNICLSKEEVNDALDAIRSLMMNAEDDYARTVFKAGDVLGDHIANEEAGMILKEVASEGARPFGRRSAIHGMIHLCEWLPGEKESVIAVLERVARTDPIPVLRQYAKATIQDILSGEPHGPEPRLPQDAA